MTDTNQVDQLIAEANKPQEKHHERGEVGTGTPASYVKNLWHQEKVKLSASRRLSLKKFVQTLITKGDETAQRWVANKLGNNAQERSDINKTLAAAAKMATRQSRRKNSDNNKNKAKAAEEAPATIITKR